MIKSFLGCSGLYVMVRKQKIWCLSSYACVLSHFSCGHLFAVLCIVAHQDPMSMGFSRQLYWSRLPLPPPGDLPDSAIESASLISPALADRFFTAIAPPGKSLSFYVVVQLLSCVQLFVTQWTAAHNASLSLTLFWSWLKFMSTEWMKSSNQITLCYPLLFLPSIFPRTRVFFRVSSYHQGAKVMELQLQHQSFQWIFRVYFL